METSESFRTIHPPAKARGSYALRLYQSDGLLVKVNFCMCFGVC